MTQREPPAAPSFREGGTYERNHIARKPGAHPVPAAAKTDLYRICGGDFADKMHLLMDFTDRPGEVADPWYTDDFDTTWGDVEEGCRGLLQKIISKEVRTSRQAGCQGSGN